MLANLLFAAVGLALAFLVTLDVNGLRVERVRVSSQDRDSRGGSSRRD